MKRYLLFDSGCSTCSAVAQEIEQEVDGQLTARSLRDLEIQNLLERAKPDWQWEPTLLEVDDERVRSYTGVAMRARLAIWLGPRQTHRLMRLVYRHSISARSGAPADASRRQFLRQSGSSLAALTLLIGAPKLHEKSPNPRWQNEDEAWAVHLADQELPLEIYENFVLLPEEAPLPAFVQKARHIDLHGRDPDFAGISTQLDSINELKKHISFPIYLPTVLPPNMQFAQASITQFVRSGGIWSVWVNFTTGNLADGQITAWARPEFPKPFPVWPVRFPFAHDEGPVLPEKINFTPSPGVMLPSMLGYSFLWIKDSVLYSLFVENSASREMAVTIATELAQA